MPALPSVIGGGMGRHEQQQVLMPCFAEKIVDLGAR